MQDNKKLSNLIAVGLSSDLSQKAIDSGYMLSKLKSAAKHELLKSFSATEVKLICDAVKRQPISDETVQRLIEESDWKCCLCWDIKNESPVVIHHIEEHSKTHDDSYENLVILCLNHHAEAHSRWDISRSPCPPELVHHRKREWIRAIAAFKAGLRPAPGNEPLSPILTVTAPSPPISFTGRNSYRSTIKDALIAGRHIALQGMGGIGKTATAQQVAVDLLGQFPGGIFWGSLADHNGNPVAILRNWLYLCKGELSAQLDSESLANYIRSLLASRKNSVGSLLVVLDDVRQEWIDAAQLIKSVIPYGSPLLLTVRHDMLVVLLDTELQPLNVMPQDEALDLLKAHAGSETIERETHDAEVLLQVIGYLPLAIELAGKRLMLLSRKPGLHLSALCREIEKRADVALQLPGHRGLAATFSITYEELSEEEKMLFRWLGIFANGPIHLQDISGLLDRDVGEVERQMDYLVSCALLSWGEEVGIYILHPLLRQYAQALLHKDEKGAEEAKQKHLEYYLMLVQNHAQENSPAHDRLEIALPNLMVAVDFAAVSRNVEALNKFGLALWVNSNFLSTRCYMLDAINILKKAVDACRNHGDRKHEGTHLNHLAVAYAHLGQTEQAFDCIKRALTINREINNSYDECANLANLSWLYRDAGQYEEALRCSQQALGIATKTHNSKIVLDALGNLGSIYRSLGNSSAAMAYYDKALEVSRLLGERLSEGNCLSNVGLIYSDLSYHVHARLCIEEALIIATEIGDRRGEGNRLGHLGNICCQNGDIEQGINHLNQALEITRQIGQRANQGEWMLNLGNAYRYLGENEKAILHYEQALMISKEVGNKESEGKALLNLGTAHRDIGYLAKAHDCLAESIAIFVAIKSHYTGTAQRLLEKLRHNG